MDDEAQSGDELLELIGSLAGITLKEMKQLFPSRCVNFGGNQEMLMGGDVS